MRRYYAAVIVLLVALVETASAATTLESQAQGCHREDQRACSKVQKELQRCKEISACISVLSLLPDVTLTSVKGDMKIGPEIVKSANDILKQRNEEKEAREAAQRAIRMQRKANFQKLTAGMSIAEVEATIGPLVAGTSFGTVKFREQAESMQMLQDAGREVHFTLTARGGQASLNTTSTEGGAPEKSSYAWQDDEFSLVFDNLRKLRAFEYRGQ